MNAPTKASNQTRQYQIRGAIGAALALAVVWLYWPITQHDFVNYDDQDYVTENQMVQHGLTWEGVHWAFTTNQAGNWHPLTWLTHMMDAEFHGMNPGGHHATSLVFHAFNSVLVLFLLSQLTGATWRSGAVAAIFALHPMHVESVAWVSERKDVLSAFFGILTLMAYAHYVHESKIQNPKSKAWYGVALLLFTLGLMSKPMLVTWPCVMLLLDFWPLGRISLADGRWKTEDGNKGWELIREKIPFLVLTVGSSVVTYLIQSSAGAVAAVEALPTVTRVENALVSYATYLGKTLWPSKLAVIYPYSQTIPMGTLLGASVVIVGISILAIQSWKARPYLLIGWLWYLGTLVPVVGLIQVGQQAMADRYTYLPSLGLTLMAVWGLADLQPVKAYRTLAVGGAAVILGGLAMASHQQVSFWRDSETLFTHALAVTENNSVAHYNLGSALAVKGQLPEATQHFREAIRINPENQEAQSDLGLALVLGGNVEEGISHYEQAIAVHPQQDKPYFNLARALSLQGRKEAAILNYERVLQLSPRHTEARKSLANLLSELERWDEATVQFEILTRQLPPEAEIYWQYGNMRRQQGDNLAAIELYGKALPLAANNPELHNGLGLALAQTGQTESAIAHFREAARLQPTPQYYYHLGLALNGGGRPAQAVMAYREALNLEPNNLENLNELAWILATHPQAARRNGGEAVTLAEKAVQLTEGKEARYLGTLDAAYAEANRFDEAIATAERARTTAQTQGQGQLATAAEKRLQLYQTKTPYRQGIE